MSPDALLGLLCSYEQSPVGLGTPPAVMACLFSPEPLTAACWQGQPRMSQKNWHISGVKNYA